MHLYIKESKAKCVTKVDLPEQVSVSSPGGLPRRIFVAISLSNERRTRAT